MGGGVSVEGDFQQLKEEYLRLKGTGVSDEGGPPSAIMLCSYSDCRALRSNEEDH